ncbi:MAG: mercury transporter [Spirochaetia bacterium]|nr:mercury transporter [Spirochaetota bacterium]MCX8096773.1 mercury transporter [Spirochaetota bacterium]MDW8112547.1 mercury transporter [Spirochaetia bacterium]
MTYEIKVGGMTCQGCVNAVKMAIMTADKNAIIKDIKIGKVVVETEQIEKLKNSISLYGYKVEEIKKL